LDASAWRQGALAYAPGRSILTGDGWIDVFGGGEHFRQLHRLEQVAARLNLTTQERLVGALGSHPQCVQQVGVETDL
jgi:hypothetical protein